MKIQSMSSLVKYSIVVIIFLMGSFSKNFAQKAIGNEQPEVKVIAAASKDVIRLRWAVTTPLAWKYANTYGFKIIRKTIVSNGEVINPSEVTSLASTILPKPLTAWDPFIDNSDAAAIAAQAIYGDDFDVDMENGGDGILKIVNQAQVLEQRFSVALYAADQDYEVAKLSGLAYVDTSVKPNEKYFYEVISNIPTEKLNVGKGGVYIGLEDHQPLPKPVEFTGVFKDKTALLSWNYKLLQHHYNSYIVERADHASDFKPLQDVPVIHVDEGADHESSERIIYIDSLSQNNHTYKYRIKGISPFGDIGPPSDEIEGKGQKALLHNPAITVAKLHEHQKSAVITWEFPEKGLEALDYFEVNRSNTVKGHYSVVQSQIPKTKNTIEINDLQAINYYTITAVGKDGSKRTSFPQKIEPLDSTPPVAPLGLIGQLDAKGVAVLRWNKNIENDLLGYRVFRATVENNEFTQLTVDPIVQNRFVDTVQMNLANKEVFYKVQAFDRRYNPSGFSEVLKLKKPDIIPPTQPVFESYNVEEGKVQLQWISSSSEDALKTLVYRKEKGTKTPWELIAEPVVAHNTHLDSNTIPDKEYLYTLVSVDETGLESEPITPLSIKIPDYQKIIPARPLNAVVNREEQNIRLDWKYKNQNIKEIHLYKAKEDAPITLYKIFDTPINSYTDTQLKINTTYVYALRVIRESGTSTMEKKITITY